jgi:hypothetical protein
MDAGINVNAHGGGPIGNATVNDTGTTVIVPDTGPRRYLIVQADKDNTGPIFIRMDPTLPAVFGSGIVLYPGGFQEWTWDNMYWGPIRGITAPGTTQKAYFHEGK